MIDITNWEAYLMLRIDDELSPAETAELNTFLAAHPELANEVATYEASVIMPEEQGVFEEKESLYRPVSKSFNFRPLLWAAAAALLIAIGVRLTPEKNAPAFVVAPKKENVVSVKPVVLPAQTGGVAVPPAVKSPVQTGAVVKNKQPQHLAEKAVAIKKEINTPAEMQLAIVPLEVQSDRELAVANVLLADAQFQIVETPIRVAVTPEKTAHFAVQLPFLNSIKEAAKEGFPQIQNAREKLRGTETTVMLFDRKLFTINL